MSIENEMMELNSVLDDIRIEFAGKGRCLFMPSEYEVVNEAKQRLQNYGYNLIQTRAALKDVVKAQKDLDRAQLRLDKVTGNVQDETDEKEAE